MKNATPQRIVLRGLAHHVLTWGDPKAPKLVLLHERGRLVLVEIAAVGVGEPREIVCRNGALEMDAPPVHAIDQCLDWRLQVNHEIRRRRVDFQLRIDLCIKRVFGVGQIEARKQRILVEQEIGDGGPVEKVELPDVAQQVDALKEKSELRRQRVTRHEIHRGRVP